MTVREWAECNEKCYVVEFTQNDELFTFPTLDSAEDMVFELKLHYMYIATIEVMTWHEANTRARHWRKRLKKEGKI